MKVIPPITITDAMLTSSTMVDVAPSVWSSGTTYNVNDTVSVAGAAGLMSVYKSLQASNTNHAPASNPTWWQYLNDTYQAWNSGTTYALNDYVQDNTTHKVYQSLVGSNLNNAVTDSTKWNYIGPTQRWSIFDTTRNTASVSNVTQTIVLTPGKRIDSIALLGLSATSATITMVSSGVTVYTRTINLNLRFTSGWYDYFFKPFLTQPNAAYFDLPPYANGVLTVSVSNSNGPVKVGALVIGSNEYIGAVQYEAENDVLNFSTIDRDATTGDSVLIPRRNVPKTIQNIVADKSRVDRIRYLRDALNAIPAVWAGLEDNGSEYFEALLILGIYKRFTINLKDYSSAVVSLELEEI